MKSRFSSPGPLAAIAAMAALAGCASMQDARYRQHHPETAASQAPGMMRDGAAGDQMGMMDMKTMCDMHERMMNAKTPEEQRAMMDEHMKTIPPEVMQKHIDMMRERCKR